MSAQRLDLPRAARLVIDRVREILADSSGDSSAELSAGPLLVAIDGRCASGKSSLAGHICGETGWGILHMDDFFLRPEQRTPARLAEPGGNVDRERFLDQVLLPLSQGREAVYRPYDCRTQSLGEERRLAGELAGERVVLVEGSYSCHPRLWDYYGLHLFLTVDPGVQLRRIEARNGPEKLEDFRGKWIPLEERYFSAFSLHNRCEILLELGG